MLRDAIQLRPKKEDIAVRQVLWQPQGHLWAEEIEHLREPTQSLHESHRETSTVLTDGSISQTKYAHRQSHTCSCPAENPDLPAICLKLKLSLDPLHYGNLIPPTTPPGQGVIGPLRHWWRFPKAWESIPVRFHPSSTTDSTASTSGPGLSPKNTFRSPV